MITVNFSCCQEFCWLDNPKKQAVGFKLSEGMEVPRELEGKYKFIQQKSKLGRIIRSPFFVVEGEY